MRFTWTHHAIQRARFDRKVNKRFIEKVLVSKTVQEADGHNMSRKVYQAPVNKKLIVRVVVDVTTFTIITFYFAKKGRYWNIQPKTDSFSADSNNCINRA